MYLSFPNLQRDPFRIAPDPHFLYPSKQHSRARSYIQSTGFLIDGFVIITGEIGAGKTILIRDFLDELPSTTVAVAIHQTQITPVQFLQSFLVGLGAEPFGKEKIQLLSMINTELQRNRSRRKQTVLILDEAQNLSDAVLEEIRLLSGIETGDERVLSVILAGQPGLRNRLMAPRMRQLTQRAPLHFHLGPLNEADTVRYIKHRLSVAGDSESRIFLPETFEIIYDRSGGIPRVINVLCSTALLCAFAEDQSAVSAATVREALNELQWTPLEPRAEAPAHATEPEALKAKREPPDAEPEREAVATAKARVGERFMPKVARKVRRTEKKARTTAQNAAPDESSSRLRLEGEVVALSETINALKAELLRERKRRPPIRPEQTELAAGTRIRAAQPTRIETTEAVVETPAPPAPPDENESGHGSDQPMVEARPGFGDSARIPSEHPAAANPESGNGLAGTPDRHEDQPSQALGSLVGLDDASGPLPVYVGRLRLGSGPDNDVQLRRGFVSPHHAELIASSNSCVIRDLNSTNGTYVNAKKIMRYSLRHGDHITIGNHHFEYVGHGAGSGPDSRAVGDRVRIRP